MYAADMGTAISMTLASDPEGIAKACLSGPCMDVDSECRNSHSSFTPTQMFMTLPPNRLSFYRDQLNLAP